MRRVVLVTGGSRGIGRAVAARFAAAGDDVVITGRDADTLTEAAAAIGVRAVPCDGTSVQDVARLVTALDQDRDGDQVGLDVVVHAAGGNTDFDRRPPGADHPGPAVDVLEALSAAWHANLDANLLSAVLVTAAVRERLRPGGSVITFGSIGAEYASTSYGAAKAAVAAWTAGLSATLGPDGVTANTISPGYIQDTGFFQGTLTDERRRALIAATHDQRAGTVDDVAGVAYFLASPHARHITGQTIHVNGGAHTTR